MKKKGFTLVELLVVIAIIALLMGILMPALARVRAIAFRLTCGTNLSGLGKAMLIYANDYEDEFPRAGWAGSTLVDTLGNGWMAAARAGAFGNPPGQATITSCFYLLIKFADVTPKSFVCKSDSDTTEFKLADHSAPQGFELVDAWDFGPAGDEHCSYSYHIPFSLYALTTSSEPGMAIAADRNPWIDPRIRADSEWNFFVQGVQNNDAQKAKYGNAVAHQSDGQNVLFVDGHVNFETKAYCAIEEDNIYTCVSATSRKIGDRSLREPYDRRDTYLTGNKAGTGGGPPGPGPGPAD